MVILIQVDYSNRNLLAIAVGIKQKDSVDDIVQKVIDFLYNVQNAIKWHSWHFIDFSFFQKTLQLFYSIMMGMLKGGGILSGVMRPYT